MNFWLRLFDVDEHVTAPVECAGGCRLRPFPFSAGMLYTFTFWSVFALWILFEVINSRIRRSTDSSRARDRGSLQLVAFLWFAGIVLGFWFSFVLPQASILRLRQLAFFAGIILMLIGLALRQYSMKLLGQFFTFDVAIHAGHSLVEIGPYRYIRHPSYSGALLTMLGFRAGSRKLGGAGCRLALPGNCICLSHLGGRSRSGRGARQVLPTVCEPHVAAGSVSVLEL